MIKAWRGGGLICVLMFDVLYENLGLIGHFQRCKLKKCKIVRFHHN